MYALLKKLTLTAIVATFAQVALAAEYQVTVQGQLARDTAASVFGITDASVPVQVSFIVESASVQTLASGSVIDNSSGASFNSTVHVVSASAVRDVVATIGSVSFSEANLVNNPLGTTGLNYDILLVGELAENGLTQASFSFDNGADGNISFGALQCIVSCNVTSNGFSEDYLSGGTATLSGIQVFTQALTPPPSAKQLLIDLAADIKADTSIKSLVKLVLNVPLAITNIALKKGNLVQASNSMKAFIALLKPLVKAGKLSQAQADDFKAQADAIIAAM